MERRRLTAYDGGTFHFWYSMAAFLVCRASVKWQGSEMTLPVDGFTRLANESLKFL
jgi:hypothetical protein